METTQTTQKNEAILASMKSNNDTVRDCREPSAAEIAAFQAGHAFVNYRVEKAAHKSLSPQG